MLSEEAIKEFQEIYKKNFGKELTYGEAADSARRLMSLAKICYDHMIEEQRRKKKLEEFPKGYYLDGVGYHCSICGDSIPDKQAWYDKYGIKCPTCQKAINKKIIPATVAKNENSWYSKYDLERCFNIDRHTMNRFIKQGILKPRIVLNEIGKPHVYLFLIKDNKGTLPPKKLVKSKMVKEVRDGKEWFSSEPWYKFGDPKEILKGYKIMDYLRVITEEKKV